MAATSTPSALPPADRQRSANSSTRRAATLSISPARASLLGKWKCRAPALTPARLLIAGSDARAYPS